MTLVTDYASLVSAIQGYIEDDGTEFEGLIPNAITNAFKSISREIDPVGFNALVSVTATGLNPSVPLPSDILVIKSVAKTSAGRKKFLMQRPYTYLVELWPAITSGGGNPNYYTRMDDLSLYVAPTPTSTQSLEVRGVVVSIPTSANPTCHLLDKYPGLVLSRCMVEANLIKKDIQDADIWGKYYDREREGIENEARRNRRDDGFQPIHSLHFENTLKGTE